MGVGSVLGNGEETPGLEICRGETKRGKHTGYKVGIYQSHSHTVLGDTILMFWVFPVNKAEGSGSSVQGQASELGTEKIPV